ncbi:hypothetical protein BpHYR1_002703 [Brachionus plicatilis]|uniref:Uncharacterized protein n=1 Tax=Brachionus plicatilis TaxID=10195 RepID=A0A3M7QHL2_BRAPC|nr:hypothetical protein BpHYR1_002703 [Brachionus plicatilis]
MRQIRRGFINLRFQVSAENTAMIKSSSQKTFDAIFGFEILEPFFILITKTRSTLMHTRSILDECVKKITMKECILHVRILKPKNTSKNMEPHPVIKTHKSRTDRSNKYLNVVCLIREAFEKIIMDIRLPIRPRPSSVGIFYSKETKLNIPCEYIITIVPLSNF